MAYLGLAYGTLLFGLILQLIAKPKDKAFIGLLSCLISAFMALILSYFIIKGGVLNSDIFTSFNYISVRIRLTPILSIPMIITALMSVLISVYYFAKNKTRAWIVTLGTFLLYFCIGIDSILIAFITFILFCALIRYAICCKH